MGPCPSSRTNQTAVQGPTPAEGTTRKKEADPYSVHWPYQRLANKSWSTGSLASRSKRRLGDRGKSTGNVKVFIFIWNFKLFLSGRGDIYKLGIILEPVPLRISKLEIEARHILTILS